MSEKELKIGSLIAEVIEDGSTLQMGIGTIPNACLKALNNHKNLGIHTEMFSDGLLDLIDSGVITGNYKLPLKTSRKLLFTLFTKKRNEQSHCAW